MNAVIKDSLLKGNRKLLAFGAVIVGVVALGALGKMESGQVQSVIEWAFAFFIGGNVGEHATKKINGSK